MGRFLETFQERDGGKSVSLVASVAGMGIDFRLEDDGKSTIIYCLVWEGTKFGGSISRL